MKPYRNETQEGVTGVKFKAFIFGSQSVGLEIRRLLSANACHFLQPRRGIFATAELSLAA